MYTKKQLLDLLKRVYQDKDLLILGEEMTNRPDMVSFTLERFKKSTGKYPGILGLDLRKSNLHALGDEGIARVVAELTEYAERGGIVTASAHMANPSYKSPDTESYRGYIGLDDAWEKLYTEGTEENKYFKIELSAIADLLERLKNNGVPVIWRPLHEANGNWFWFCIYQRLPGGIIKEIREKTFVKAWRYIYEYFTEERGLDNLLWEYSPNIVKVGHPAMTQALYGYPGYMCDLVGFDWYTAGGYELEGSNTYRELASTGKPVALCEFGPAGKLKADKALDQVQSELFSCEDMLDLILKMKKDGYSFSYLLTWTSPITVNEMGKCDILIGHDGILSLEDIAEMYNATL